MQQIYRNSISCVCKHVLFSVCCGAAEKKRGRFTAASSLFSIIGPAGARQRCFKHTHFQELKVASTLQIPAVVKHICVRPRPDVARVNERNAGGRIYRMKCLKHEVVAEWRLRVLSRFIGLSQFSCFVST